ncbi:serine/threonine-protein kinase [Prosthecobacter sp.]|uniref:serine/threonine-protein kinase n=1 Tax=Prosthecobacter sp. TaxID=1965333 RepID=UPI00378395FB
MSETSPTPSSQCTRCGDALPPGYQPGLCPVCLMDLAMRPTHDDTLPVAPPQKPLSPEELAPHFPQLEIMECIGRGGMGVVYKARQKTLDRLVALKLLAPEQKKDAAFAERFAHEARALAALNHPSIVTVHDFGESGGFFYLLMEYVDGVNLRQAMRGSHLSAEQALAIVPPICQALQYAHEHGIVHRDIKPENLLLDKGGRVMIADFGIAKMMGGGKTVAEETQSGTAPHSTMVAGTPEYMAPEQRTASATADHRADIYSLGVVLYELLTGKRPPSTLELPLQEAGTKTLLDEIVRRALQVDPAQRYQTVAELQQHLATLSNPPAEMTVHPRETYQRWFCWLLRAAGVVCACYGVTRLVKTEVMRRSVVIPPWLNLSLLFFIAAGVLIVHARWLTRISYRPLLLTPRVHTEVAGLALRLAGLFGVGKALAMLRISWLQSDLISLILGVLLLGLSLALFRFEHALAPMAYAIPSWRPLPYADTPRRRHISGHAMVGALLLTYLLVLFSAFIKLLHRKVGYEAGMDLSVGLLQTLAFWGCVTAMASTLGWAAVNLIRGSAGRLYGLGLACAVALALPLYLGFILLVFLVYRTATNLSLSFITLPDGSVVEDLSRHPAMLAAAVAVALAACLACWLWVWKKLRALPRPLPGGPLRPRTAFSFAGGLAFATLLVAMYSLTTRMLPPPPKIAEPSSPAMSPAQAPVPATGSSFSKPQPNTPLPPYEPRFARHVERQLNLRLFIHGYSHTLPQGSLKLPPDRRMMTLKLPNLRDDEGRHTLNGSLLLSRNEESLLVMSEKAMPEMRFTVSQRTEEALPKEMVIPIPQAGTRCLGSLFGGYLIESSADLQQHLQTHPDTLTAEDTTWLRQHHADLMVQANEDGTMALRIFGGSAVPVLHTLPANSDWLQLSDREFAKSLVKAYASIPAEGSSALVREQSPALLAFATRTHCGLMENLGPSKPGAKDARIRYVRLTFNPFR